MNESFQQRWTRRGLSISLMFFALFTILALYPLVLLVALVADIHRKKGWVWIRVGLFAFWYVLFECLGIIAAGWIWLVHLGGKRAGEEAYLQANFQLQCWWTKMLGLGSSQIFSAPFQVEGTEAVEEGPMLLLLRHASLTDTVIAGLFVSVPNQIVLRYVLKKELLWDPCLDIVGNRLPNYFVDRQSTNSEQEVENVAALAKGLGEKEGVLIYPEGTRFSKKKQKRILEKLRDSDPEGYERASRLQHLLPPRLGGTLALLEANDGADVVFCAHAGLEKSATFAQLSNGELFNQTIHIKFWRVPYAEIPTQREERVEWLFEHWQRIDNYIETVERGRDFS